MLDRLFSIGFVVLSLSMIAAGLAHIFPTPWWLELFTHFISIYALGAAVLTVYYFWQKRRERVFICLTYFSLTLSIIAPYAVPNSILRARSNQQEITVIFANTHYSSVSVEALVYLILQRQPSFVFFAELKEAQFAEVREQLPAYSGNLIPGGPDPWAHAVSYLSLAELGEVEEEVVRFDNLSPGLVVTNKSLPDLQMQALHIFPPRSDRTINLRDIALANIAKYASKQENLVVLGDLNITNFSPPFERMLEDGGLLDARIGSGMFGSWPSVLPTFATIPIDHVLYKGAWRVCKLERGPNIGSDHFPLIATLCYNKL
ncbi:MAG: endonuclease/exonuclease/phosphatase family protein [bacterium]|nr:endonuclease/exonuclease/phosphatase family protein [bacterium]